MNKISRRSILLTGLLVPTMAYGQHFPSRTVTIITPFAPGASSDGVARIVGEKLAQLLGQSVVVENRPGGGGTTGLIALARSGADGHTIGIGATGALVINPHVPDASANFEPLRELTPIAKLVDIPLVLVANPDAGVRSLKELIDRSQQKPDGFSYGSTGVNSAQHLAIELLKKATKANLVHVPYRGSAPAMTDVLGGQIPLCSVDLTSAHPHIRAGKVVPLAITSARRLDLAPDVPTVAEQAVPNFEVTAWLGMLGPAGIPKEIAVRVSEQIKTSLADPVVRERVRQISCVDAYLDSSGFAAFLERESAKMRDFIRPG
jgi:tripartite-type tricarboxylate transporter receptor subunit TctC